MSNLRKKVCRGLPPVTVFRS